MHVLGAVFIFNLRFKNLCFSHLSAGIVFIDKTCPVWDLTGLLFTSNFARI